MSESPDSASINCEKAANSARLTYYFPPLVSNLVVSCSNIFVKFKVTWTMLAAPFGHGTSFQLMSMKVSPRKVGEQPQNVSLQLRHDLLKSCNRLEQ